MVVIAYVGNVYGAKILPLWQNAVFTIHVMVFLALVVPIWVNAPLATSKQVWLDFTVSTGWPSPALGVLIGQQTGIFGMIGIDTVGVLLRIQMRPILIFVHRLPTWQRKSEMPQKQYQRS
jgi:hypothetical protein